MLRVLIILTIISFNTLLQSYANEIRRPSETEEWSVGESAGQNILEQVKTEPGKLLYEPAVGARQYRTFGTDRNYTFDAPILDQESYVVESTVEVCIIDVTPLGLRLQVKSGPNGNCIEEFNNVAAVGNYGFVIKNNSIPSFDPPHAQVYVWRYNPESGCLAINSNIPEAISGTMELPVVHTIENVACYSPTVCGVTEQTIWLNVPSILNQIAMGILAAVREANASLIPTIADTGRAAEGLPCVKYTFVRPAQEGETGNTVRCWNSQGNFPICESIESLEERGKKANREVNPDGVLSSTETFILMQQAGSLPFYTSDNLRIDQPLALVNPQAALSGADMTLEQGAGVVYTCQVFNQPIGSLDTSWVNFVGNRKCAAHDWGCIREAVSDYCSQYESDPNCILLEEKIDGVISMQFGRDTGMAQTLGGTVGHWAAVRCFEPLISAPEYASNTREAYIAFFDVYAPSIAHGDPEVDPNIADPPRYRGVFNPQLQTYRVCGDFELVTRAYLCGTQSELSNINNEVRASIGRSKTLVQEAVEGELIYNSEYEVLTKGIDYDPGSKQWIISSFPTNVGYPGFALTGDYSECRDDEKVCVVAWCDLSNIYSDAAPRGNVGDSIPEPRCPGSASITKEVRPCEIDDSGQVYCPITPEEESRGMWIQTDCNCPSFLGEAVGYLSAIAMIPWDLKCEDEHTNPLSEFQDFAMKEMSGNCEESGQAFYITYACGESAATAAPCIPVVFQRSEPFEPMDVALWLDEEYRCAMTWVENGVWHLNDNGTKYFNHVSPKRNWFDYCLETLARLSRNTAQNRAHFIYENFHYSSDCDFDSSYARSYLECSGALNNDLPPDNLCTPNVGVGKSRQEGGCGYDYWEKVGDFSERYHAKFVGNINAEYPFGYVSLATQIQREYDCMKVGLDCNSDGWLDFFNCAWRSAGYDCSGDCIADNNYRYCDYISGWDCSPNDNCRRREYNDCKYRSSGWDFNGDCVADSTSRTVCSNAPYAPTVTRDCGTTLCDQCTGCGIKSTRKCNCQTCEREVCSWEWRCETTEDGGRICERVRECRTETRECNCQTCYTCYDKVTSNTHIKAGHYCSRSGVVSGCNYNTYHSSCSAISGYDCGRNGGSEGNQSPDGCIDNNYKYCAKVAAGWDCDHGQDPANPSFSGSNDRIEIGSCNSRSNLADSECGTRNSDRKEYKCSRKDFPGRCCKEIRDVFLFVTIRNYLESTRWPLPSGIFPSSGGHYTCELYDGFPYSLGGSVAPIDPSITDYKLLVAHSYDDPNTLGNDQVRFITEGCKDTYNYIYHSSQLVDVFSAMALSSDQYETYLSSDFSWAYVAYEDLLLEIAKLRCEWRDYLTATLCTDISEGMLPIFESRLPYTVATTNFNEDNDETYQPPPPSPPIEDAIPFARGQIDSSHYAPGEARLFVLRSASTERHLNLAVGIKTESWYGDSQMIGLLTIAGENCEIPPPDLSVLQHLRSEWESGQRSSPGKTPEGYYYAVSNGLVKDIRVREDIPETCWYLWVYNASPNRSFQNVRVSFTGP